MQGLLWFELSESGDAATYALLKPLNPKPKRQIAKLQELIDFNLGTFAHRKGLVERYVKYLCAAVDDLKGSAEFRFKVLSETFAKLRCSSYYFEDRVLLTRAVIEMWSDLSADDGETADHIIRWLAHQSGNDTHLDEKIRAMLREPNLRLSAEALQRAILLICNEYEGKHGVNKLRKSLLVHWIKEVAGYGSRESYAEVRYLMEAAGAMPVQA